MNPKPLWELVREFRESTVGIGNYGSMRPLNEIERGVAKACADALEEQLKLWDERLKDVSWVGEDFDHECDGNWVREQILGVPDK